VRRLWLVGSAARCARTSEILSPRGSQISDSHPRQAILRVRIGFTTHAFPQRWSIFSLNLCRSSLLAGSRNSRRYDLNGQINAPAKIHGSPFVLESPAMDAAKFLMQDPEDIRTAVAWGTIFEEHGCNSCASKSNTHAGWGFCLPCARKNLGKWEETKKRHNLEP
jgi:hypothetical protein